MAISFVGAVANGANTANLTLAWPTTAADDFAIVFLNRSNSTTNNTPTGFTLEAGHPYDANSGSQRTYFYTKICTGSESGSVICSTSDAASTRQSAVLFVFRGLDTSAAYIWTRFDETVSGLTHDAPAITLPVANCGILTMYGERGTDTTTAVPAPTGFTSNLRSSGAGATGAGGNITAAATDDLVTVRSASAVVDPGVWTSTDSVLTPGSGFSTANCLVYTVALAPEA